MLRSPVHAHAAGQASVLYCNTTKSTTLLLICLGVEITRFRVALKLDGFSTAAKKNSFEAMKMPT